MIMNLQIAWTSWILNWKDRELINMNWESREHHEYEN